MGRGYVDTRKGTWMIRYLLVLLLMFATRYVALGDDIDLPTAEEFSVPKVVERLARRVEPELAGKPERLAHYVDFFRSELSNDSRLCAFHVTAKSLDGNHIELLGYTEFPETRSALVKFLKVLGFKVDDQMESLPAAALGKRIFGLLKVPHSICFDQPSGRQRPENDCLIGEPLYVLREDHGHLLVHSGEGYLGFIRSKDVLRVDAAGFAKYLNGKRVRTKTNQKIGDLLIPASAR